MCVYSTSAIWYKAKRSDPAPAGGAFPSRTNGFVEVQTVGGKPTGMSVYLSVVDGIGPGSGVAQCRISRLNLNFQSESLGKVAR